MKIVFGLYGGLYIVYAALLVISNIEQKDYVWSLIWTVMVGISIKIFVFSWYLLKSKPSD